MLVLDVVAILDNVVDPIADIVLSAGVVNVVIRLVELCVDMLLVNTVCWLVEFVEDVVRLVKVEEGGIWLVVC